MPNLFQARSINSNLAQRYRKRSESKYRSLTLAIMCRVVLSTGIDFSGRHSPCAATNRSSDWTPAARQPASGRTTRLAASGLSGGMRDRRVLSRHRPPLLPRGNVPASARSPVLALPAACMISAVPRPSPSEARCLPANMLLRAVAIGDHGFKLVTVGSTQLDVRSLVHP